MPQISQSRSSYRVVTGDIIVMPRRSERIAITQMRRFQERLVDLVAAQQSEPIETFRQCTNCGKCVVRVTGGPWYDCVEGSRHSCNSSKEGNHA